MSSNATRQFNGRFVGIVGGVEHDDLVAAAHDCSDCAEQSFSRAGADRDLRGDVQLAALQAVRLFGNSLAQCGNARHRCVLIGAVVQVPVDSLGQRVGRIEAWKTLCEVDGTRIGRELTHDREDRRTNVRQFARYTLFHAVRV